jgi:NADH-quinone oxidoreductase subunit L
MSFIHIVIHAFFKSMLFLRTGSLIGQKVGLQDSRFYGSDSFSYTSFTFFLVSCLCLGGFPFFLGFYSKDYIISSLSSNEGVFLYCFFLVGCLFTVLYSLRLIHSAYFTVYKYEVYFSFSESFIFCFPVIMLFFKC